MVAAGFSLRKTTQPKGCSYQKDNVRLVIFELNAPSANKVLLIGDFNAWDVNGMPLEKNENGLWKTELELKPGKYEYKFIVDGKWQNDPANTNTVLNSYGTTNSVKEIS